MVPPMLAREYDDRDPSGFWLSEKLDGVRAIWDGEKFFSRNGKAFRAPAEIVAAMPSGVVIDGELFAGREKFQSSLSAVRSGKWDQLRFMVFDLVMDAPFEARQKALNAVQMPSFCEILPQVKCEGLPHLDQFEASIIDQGGEGVMLREPGSRYVYGRSSSLMKLKRFSCAEATVVGYEPGAGKYAALVGALIVTMAGVTFRVGSGLCDEDRESPPKIGAEITVSYFGLTDGGIPRFPTFLCGRNYE